MLRTCRPLSEPSGAAIHRQPARALLEQIDQLMEAMFGSFAQLRGQKVALSGADDLFSQQYLRSSSHLGRIDGDLPEALEQCQKLWHVKFTIFVA